eukprot:CAMPEP_0180809356 /NCGR_PEP_ID=MMETSP1038_2-20121128/64281_1 /TAXON_ID=632150 /ORGANISM="Azadinium spinosum, Strain 3D9" /LENGTH=183 /DNA_ID=CAMNT_0022850521 /DNA_START=22 /DNA_END=573 /DNA_ORIENTATION=+
MPKRPVAALAGGHEKAWKVPRHALRQNESPQGHRFPQNCEDAMESGFIKNWDTVHDNGFKNSRAISVRLPAIHTVRHWSPGLRSDALTIGLVKKGSLTLPGELLAIVVACGGIKKCDAASINSAFRNSRYKARLLASGVVGKGNKGELSLASFEPWMLGLPASFLALGPAARRKHRCIGAPAA